MKLRIPIDPVAIAFVSLFLFYRPANADFERALTSGIVYPTSDDAVATDTAALTDGRSGEGRLAYTPETGYSAMYATSTNQFGYGFALNSISAGTLTLGAAIGGSVFHLGLDLSINGSLNPGNATFGLSGIMGGVDGFRLAATLSSLLKSESDNLTLGLGYAKSGQFQIEVDFKVPTTQITGKGNVYTVDAAAMKYFGGFGIGLLLDSTAGINPAAFGSPNFGGTLQINLAPQTSLDLRYTEGTSGGFGLGFITKL